MRIVYATQCAQLLRNQILCIKSRFLSSLFTFLYFSIRAGQQQWPGNKLFGQLHHDPGLSPVLGSGQRLSGYCCNTCLRAVIFRDLSTLLDAVICHQSGAGTL